MVVAMSKKSKYLLFKDARRFVHTLHLKSWEKWKDWSKSGERPKNVPSDPARTYRGPFVSWPDFLGYEGQQRGKMLPFEEARVVVQRYKLGSQKAWQAWCKTGGRPSNIPSAPDKKVRRFHMHVCRGGGIRGESEIEEARRKA